MKTAVKVLRSSIVPRQFFVIIGIFASVMMCVLCPGKPADAAGWSDVTVRMLPDSSFAGIEALEGGQKVRHCPHHDVNGKLDTEQLIYVIGTLSLEQWADPSRKEAVEKHLEQHYSRLNNGTKKGELKSPININTASLTELVKIPSIGPVLAVGITDYRDKKGVFKTTEDIQKVKGIGKRTFNAIAHYIRVE